MAEARIERQKSMATELTPVTPSEYDTHVRTNTPNARRARVNTARYPKQRASSTAGGNRHTCPKSSSFLNRMVRYLGDNEASMLPETKEAGGRLAESLVERVMAGVVKLDGRFKGRFENCGSFYEGMKVKVPNEFDYIWELDRSSLTPDLVEYYHVRPDTFKPRKNKDVYGKTYYKLAFKQSSVPRCWREQSSRHDDFLNPRHVQEQFHAVVQKATSALLGDPGLEALVKTSGPAVTLFAGVDKAHFPKLLNKKGAKKARKNNVNVLLVKIDITLAIPMEREAGGGGLWPFESRSDVVLDPDSPVSRCHFVAAGDYWRLSFSLDETERMKELARDVNKAPCFRALKYLRDELSLTSDYETGLLGTYPLKVTFMKEDDDFYRPTDWDPTKLATRTENVLKRVEEDGSTGTLTSFFVHNDPVLLESDRSYLESKRIRQYMDKMAQRYRVNGYIHLATFILVTVLQVFVTGLSAYYVKQECQTKDGIVYPDYMFLLLPATYLSLGVSMFGMLSIIIQRYCLLTTSVLYKMFSGPLWTYVAFTVDTAVQTIFVMTLAVLFDKETFKDCPYQLGEEDRKVIVPLIGVVLTTSILLLAYVVFHCVSFTAFARGHIKYYSWEVVFFDTFYREMWGSVLCCRRRGRGEIGERPPEPYPRQESLSLDRSLSAPRPDLENVYEDTSGVIPRPPGRRREEEDTSGVIPRPPGRRREEDIVYEDTSDVIVRPRPAPRAAARPTTGDLATGAPKPIRDPKQEVSFALETKAKRLVSEQVRSGPLPAVPRVEKPKPPPKPQTGHSEQSLSFDNALYVSDGEEEGWRRALSEAEGT